MSSNFTPEMTARFDQDMTAAKAAMDVLVRRLREQAAEDGQAQAMANLALGITQLLPAGVLMDTLMAALHELAFCVENPGVR